MRKANIGGVFGAVQVFLFATSAVAARLDVPPNADAVQQIASNVPESGNVWTGVSQSFTAPFRRLGAGFYMWDMQGAGGKFRYALHEGDGIDGKLLAQKIVKMPAGHPYEIRLVMANFSNVRLTVGQRYTLIASLPDGGLPPTGTDSPLTVRYAGTTDGTAYPDGSFYYTGSSYPVDWFSGRDIAFRLVGPAPAAMGAGE